jgi:hypothetical protein
VIELTSTATDTGPPEMVDLFSSDGTTYQIPAKPRVNIALRFLWHARQYGEDRAAAELLESLLGAKGFQALVEYDDLKPEQFMAIMGAAQKVTLGALEAAQGNSASGLEK